MIIIDRRGGNAQSFIRIRRHPTYEEVAALFRFEIDRSRGAAAAAPGEWYWRLIGFSLNEGPVVYRAEARDAGNNPLPGVRIVRHWPSAPALRDAPHLYSSRGVIGVTEFGGDKYGAVEFTYTGDSVVRDNSGPDSFWIISATPDGKYLSDRAARLGWWGEFNHFNPSPIFQLTRAGGEPQPQPDPDPPEDPDVYAREIVVRIGNQAIHTGDTTVVLTLGAVRTVQVAGQLVEALPEDIVITIEVVKL